MMPLRTLMCQNPGIFLRFKSANMIASVRHAFFAPLGPRYLAMKSFAEGCVAMPATAAPTVATAAIALRRIAADIVMRSRRWRRWVINKKLDAL